MTNNFLHCSITGSWAFVCEVHYWPVVHIVMPFIFYFYLRDFTLNVALIFLFEYIEAWLVTAFGNYFIFIANITLGKVAGESLGDSYISDGSIGVLSTIAAIGYVKLLRFPSFVPPRFLGYERLWFKYALQLLIFALPSVAIQIYFADGLFSIGFTILTLSFPLSFIAFYYWNVNDPRHINVTKYQGLQDPNYKVKKIKEYTIVNPNPIEERNRYIFMTYIFFIFLASFTYRYSSVFIMATLHGAIFWSFPWIYLLALKYTNVPKYPKTEYRMSKDRVYVSLHNMSQTSPRYK